MQGPFSEELNVAMMRSVHAKWMVTKESGKAGGFGEKVSAAKKAGVGLVVIGRPAEDGISLEDGIKYLEKNFSLAASDGHEKDDADDRPEQVGESCQTGGARPAFAFCGGKTVSDHERQHGVRQPRQTHRPAFGGLR